MTDIVLELEEIKVKRGELRVSYQLANRGDAAIYVYNLVTDRHAQLGRKPSEVPTPQLAQTCLLPPSTALMMLGPTPGPNYGPEVTFYGTPRPLLSKVAAGKATGATIRATLPLAEWSESWMPMRTGDAIVTVDVVALRLVAVYVHEADVEWKEESPEFRGCFELGARAEHRVEVDRPLTDLGLTMLTHPLMRRFS